MKLETSQFGFDLIGTKSLLAVASLVFKVGRQHLFCPLYIPVLNGDNNVISVYDFTFPFA